MTCIEDVPLEELVEVVEVDGAEGAVFDLGHQSLQLNPQRACCRHGQHEGHQKRGPRGEAEDLQAAANEEGDANDYPRVGEVGLEVSQGQQGQAVLLPAVQLVLHELGEGQAAEDSHRQADPR